MIPLRLTVKNFMCYRDDVPTLDLEGIHVACLCGDNGHGKTALLDAVTWALWGQARARTQDELVHQGQMDMAVVLDFVARGQRYRVNRRYSRSARSRQGTTILELQVTSADGVRPITGNSVRETETRVREILNLDYETFVNTAFLRQGDADRFATSRPAERKATLAEVLDLSYYQGLEDRAKARTASIRVETLAIDAEIDWRQRETARRPENVEQLASVGATLARVTPEADAQRQTVDRLRRQADSLQTSRLQLDELVRRLVDGRRDAAHLEGQVRIHDGTVSGYQSVMQRESEILEQFGLLTESKAELERLGQALAVKNELDGRKAALEREVAVQSERLSGQVARLRARVADDLEPRAARLPEIQEALRIVVREQDTLAETEETIRQQRDESQEVAARARDLLAANERLRVEMEETRKKFDMLEQGDTVCPLCQQPLGPEGQDHLRREYEAHGLEGKRRYQQNASEHTVLEGTQKELATGLSRLESTLDRERRKTQSQATGLERDLESSKTAQSELQPALAELQKAESRLASGDFAREERRLLSELDAQIAALGHDADAHRSARERVSELGDYHELHRRLLEAVEGLPVAREALETARTLLARRGEDMRAAEAQQGALEERLEDLPALESQLGEAHARSRDLDRERDAALVRQGVLEQQVARCDELEGELGRHQQERHRLLDEKSVYDELAVAFGKNGIQALIIETAIPVLQNDANALLGRLTENRMSLKLQLQEGRRDSRSGMPSEELDIKIADEVGTRSYETFSGGEAFRISFALRIALSRLLARRSGAPLPILFIDEGFGSQDTAGQERLTEAIQSIQDDFEKIIVITHIDQVKEAFPVRIEVTKTSAGSTFEVV